MDETTLRQSFYKFIKPYFDFISGGVLPEKEIAKGLRPDFIFYHKSDIDKKYRLVIEAKKDGKKKGTEINHWLKQAASYKIDKQTFVFTLPRFSGWYISEGLELSKHDIEKQHHCNIGSFVYDIYKIGQVVSYDYESKKYVKFLLRDKCIWDSRTNLLNFKWLDIL